MLKKEKVDPNVVIYGYEWINPHKIKLLYNTLAAKGNNDASTMLLLL
jgi:hypothetical protein